MTSITFVFDKDYAVWYESIHRIRFKIGKKTSRSKQLFFCLLKSPQKTYKLASASVFPWLSDKAAFVQLTKVKWIALSESCYNRGTDFAPLIQIILDSGEKPEPICV